MNPLTTDGLSSGHQFDVCIETWDGPHGLGGLPAGGSPVAIGGGSPDLTTAHLTWTANGAAGCKIYSNLDKTAKKTESKADKEGKLVSGEKAEAKPFCSRANDTLIPA
ncbi:hypothetical protein BBO_07646 [Beauveria brongniartii RCEF 3172]|uniref:Uncharacterized protein n=1 Tax=Beauveria brongniartii RCEF 3172 TaxID=1081107 RepID=A0A166YUF8_9HYPO|nr:hypothetical protein BBO_07646 [Beauveria brongniartii RCEF 3172]